MSNVNNIDMTNSNDAVNSIEVLTKDISGNSKYVKTIRWKIWKNVIVMSVVFMLNYIAFGGLSPLQSSLHVQEGMGVICTSIRYIALVIFSLFLPVLLIRGIGHKWTVTVSLMGFVVWVAANGYGVWATMVPASIINGVFVGPLWAAQGSYFTGWTEEYAKQTNQKSEGVVTLFFGIFYSFYLVTAVFANIISTMILKSSPPENYTAMSDEDIALQCGIHDCPWNEFNSTNDEKPKASVVWTLVGIYIIFAICAVILSIVAIDDLPKHIIKAGDNKPFREDFKQLMSSTIRLMARKELWLLIPITFYTGIEKTFFYAEYNLSWVTCALGIWMIGFVNVPFGLTSAVVSYFSGSLTKLIGRVPIMCIALVMDISVQLTLTFWTPVSSDNSDSWVYYIISLVWGTYHGIWLTLTSALYGITFPNDSEAAYSNYMVFQCLGYASAFGYSFFLCTEVKLYIMFGSLIVGIVCYFILEVQQKRQQDTDFDVAEKEEAPATGEENIAMEKLETYSALSL